MADNQQLKEQMQQLAALAREADDKQRSFLQHTLLVSSSTFGILISLHIAIPESLCTRRVFALAVAILALGILCNAISLYSQTRFVDRGRKAFADECIVANKQGRNPEQVVINKTKLHAFCEPATYILLIAALLLLATYFVWSLVVA